MTQTNLSALIDAYATLKKKIGILESEKKLLERSLAELPAGSYETEDNRLTISDSVREGVDKVLGDEIKAIVEAYKAGLSRQYLTAHTTETPVRTHRISLPTGKDLSS